MKLLLPHLIFSCFCLLFPLAHIDSAIGADENGYSFPPYSPASISAFYRTEPNLQKTLRKIDCKLGAPIFIRIFKLEAELEVWVHDGTRYRHLKTYTICDYSGDLGPKLQEGDKQSPEGFYYVGRDMMHPWSKYHLAFNLGYPNKYDQNKSRTGSNIMIHGRCSSVGCFAMADFRMDEIYTLADAALKNGQTEFGVHIFPFRMDQENLSAHRNNRWHSFWMNLKEGYDWFERTGLPPVVQTINNRYSFSNGPLAARKYVN